MSGIAEAIAISAAVSLISAGITYALSPVQEFEGARQKDLLTAKSNYGVAIPWCWGTVRVGENKIWSGYKVETRKKQRQGKGAKVETTNYSYFGNYASLFCDCPFRPIVKFNRIWMNKKLVYSLIGGEETIAEGGKFAERYLRFYLGELTQNIDPLLQNLEPILNYNYGIPSNKAERNAFLLAHGIDPATQALTPAYNKRAYMVAERIPLEDFYGALPSSDAEIVASEDCTVGQIFGDIFGLVYPDYEFDLSHISTPEFAVDGYAINSIDAAKTTVSNLQKSHFIDIIQTGNGFKFVPLNSPRDVINLNQADLAAHQSSSQKPLDYEITCADSNTLPSKILVSYIDKDLNYDNNQQQSTLVVGEAKNDNTTTLSLNEVMDGNKALTIANRTLMLAWILARDYKLTLPQSYLDLEATDLVANVFDNKGYPIKIEQMRIGANLTLQCEGKLHDVSPLFLSWSLAEGNITTGIANYTTTIDVEGIVNAVSDNQGKYLEGTDYNITDGGIVINSTGNIPEGTELVITTNNAPTQSEAELGLITSTGDTELLILDIPLIRDSDADYTIYLTGGGDNNWRGANIYYSNDNSRYILASELNTYGIYGVCSTTLAESDSVSVSVNQSELESISDNDLILGFNLALIGNEIIQFKTAQLVDTNTYLLSDITRGLRGTEGEINNHQTGDRFVLLRGENAVLEKLQATAFDIREVRYFKAVSAGQTLDEAAARQITIQGNAQKPYSPINLAATKDAEGNITVTWQRRDRHAALNTVNPPLSETAEDYNIKILDENFNLIKTDTSKSQSYHYPISDQTTDFGVTQNFIIFSVAQVSEDVGFGTYATEQLIPTLS